MDNTAFDLEPDSMTFGTEFGGDKDCKQCVYGRHYSADCFSAVLFVEHSSAEEVTARYF